MSPLVLACLLTSIVYMGIFMRIPIIPLYAKSIGASTAEVGLIAFSFMMIASILAIPLGSLSDRFGRKRLILVGLSMSSLTSFALAFTKTPGEMMVIYALAGLGASSFAPAMSSFVGDITSVERMGRSYGWYTSSMQVGMASGPAVGGLVAGYAGYASSFLFSGALILVGFLVALTLPVLIGKEPRYGGLQHIRDTLGELGGNRKVLACWLATFCIAFAFGVFHPFFPLYAQTIGLTAFTIGILFGVNSFFNAFARIPAGYFSDRLGRRSPFILSGMVILALFMAVVVTFTDIFALLALVAIVGLTMGITTMAISTSIAESVRQKSRGTAMGGFSTFLYGGFAISAALMGKIISAHGFWAGFLAASTVCCLGSVLFYALRR